MWRMASWLDPLARVAVGHEAFNVLTHGWPEVLAREQLVRLIPFRVSGYWCVVVCTDEAETEIMIWILRHVETVLVEEASVGLAAIRQ